MGNRAKKKWTFQCFDDATPLARELAFPWIECVLPEVGTIVLVGCGEVDESDVVGESLPDPSLDVSAGVVPPVSLFETIDRTKRTHVSRCVIDEIVHIPTVSVFLGYCPRITTWWRDIIAVPMIVCGLLARSLLVSGYIATWSRSCPTPWESGDRRGCSSEGVV